MTLGTWTKAAAVIAAGAVGSARADDGEAKVSIEKLPAPVRAALKAKFPGAELKGASKETEEGGTIFEVSLTYRGDKYDVAVEPDGEIEEVERAIFVDALPSAVLKAIKAKYPKAEIEEAEEVTDEDGEVCYEVAIEHDGKEIEVAVSPKGKIKKAEDEAKAEKRETHDGDGQHEKTAEKHGKKAENHEKKGEKHED